MPLDNGRGTVKCIYIPKKDEEVSKKTTCCLRSDKYGFRLGTLSVAKQLGLSIYQQDIELLEIINRLPAQEVESKVHATTVLSSAKEAQLQERIAELECANQHLQTQVAQILQIMHSQLEDEAKESSKTLSSSPIQQRMHLFKPVDSGKIDTEAPVLSRFELAG